MSAIKTFDEVAEPTVESVTIVERPTELPVFLESATAATLWRRNLSSDFHKWMDQLPPENLPHGRLILRSESVGDAVLQLCEMAEMPAAAGRDLFINDVTILSALFAKLMDAKYLQLRLDKVSDNACCKFHRDAITARLVCTYRGTGTQYGIPDGDGDPRDIFTAPTGSPFLMRGTLWPETPHSNLKHRSPPIEGTNETRLLLVLDSVFDTEDAI